MLAGGRGGELPTFRFPPEADSGGEPTALEGDSEVNSPLRNHAAGTIAKAILIGDGFLCGV